MTIEGGQHMKSQVGRSFVDGLPAPPLESGKIRLTVAHGTVKQTIDFDDDYSGFTRALRVAAKALAAPTHRPRRECGPSPRLHIEFFDGRRCDHTQVVGAVEHLETDTIYDNWELNYISPAVRSREAGGAGGAINCVLVGGVRANSSG